MRLLPALHHILVALGLFTAIKKASSGTPDQAIVHLTPEQFKEGMQVGYQFLEDRERLEREMIATQKHTVREGSPAFRFTRLKPHNPEALAKSKEAYVGEVARRHLSNKLGVPANRIDFKDRTNYQLQSQDRDIPTCDPSYPYRSYDGSCNSLDNPQFGQAGTVYQHIHPEAPVYNDHISEIRKAGNGSPLPSPRLISTTVTSNNDPPTANATLLIMQWGQFLDHDLVSTPTATLENGQSIDCCQDILIGFSPAMPVHPECLPIDIPPADPVYSGFDCMNFVRSTFGHGNGIDKFREARHQINANSHWLDGSQIYGSDEKLAFQLRDTSSGMGLLKTSISGPRAMLPENEDSSACCKGNPYNVCPTTPSCFVAGDSRVAEQPLLTVMHTLWVREHNRVARNLAKLLPGKDDEFYYQKARRIVVAELQHITYREYLTVLLGPEASMLALNGTFLADRFGDDPAIFSEFATAAFRMGHSQIKSFISLLKADGATSPESYYLADSFLSTDKLLDAPFMDDALRGLTRTPVQSVDNCFADDITSQLFKFRGKFGLDLVALNIQRGRDHGLIRYTDAVRHLVGSPVVTSFGDLSPITPPYIISAFEKLYGDVSDIDLYIGGVTETPLPGSLLGPTFTNIIAGQFSQLKRLDRFFYNDLSQSVSLTKGELAEIEKTSMARIICDNSDGTITEIQPKAFQAATRGNSMVSCKTIPGINFNNLM